MKISVRNLFQGVMLALAVGFLAAGSAMAADITYNANTTIALTSPAINVTIVAVSTATSLVVNTGSFTVTVPASGSFTVTSATLGLTVSGDSSASVISLTCSGGIARLVISPGASPETIIVTPTSGQCSPGTGGGNPGGGGGGGAPTPAAPTASFTDDFTAVTSGQAVTLSWSTTNTTSVSIDQGIGAVASSGTKVVNPSQTTTYTLTASGSGGTITKTLTVTVGPVNTPVTPPSGLQASGAHGPGSAILTPDGTVWFVMPDGTRRAFTSGGAFLSYGYLSFSQVVPANAADEALGQGAFIPPMDGKIVCSDRDDSYAKKGTCYLITGGKRAAFTSAKVFTALGFKFSHTTNGDVSFLSTDANISDSALAHRPGVLVNNNGTVQLVGPNSLMGIPSMSVLASWGYTLADVVPANAADKAITQSGVMPVHVVGELSP
jgi:hypothetical protein